MASVGFLISHARVCPAATEKRELVVDGRTRSYFLELPDGSRPQRLLIALHGGGEDVEVFIQRSEALRKEAKKRKFALVFPAGWKKTWEDGRPEKATGGDDLGFTRGLIASLAKEFKVSPKRVFAFGFSNGGGFVFRMGCELSGSVRAGAVANALMAASLFATCHPQAPFPLLIMTSPQDPVIPPKGGMIVNKARQQGRVLSLHDTEEFWKLRNGTKGSVEMESLDSPLHVWPAPEAERQAARLLDFFLDKEK